MRILRVGDPHAKVNVIEEMKALIEFVCEQATLNRVDRIEVLGDLFHTHNVIRLEVIEFWTWAFDKLSQTCETVVIVGNHDLSGDYNSNFSALTVFGMMGKPNLHIIEKPTLLGNIGYVPYTHDASSFIRHAGTLADSGAKVLVCHQTIEGSKYESGMFAPDGIPAAEWAERFEHVISGHIHSTQGFGNIIYPGTARWDSLSDANQPKGIWYFDHDQSGRIRESRCISTENVCSPIKSIEWREGDPEPASWNANERVGLELIGSSAWIGIQKARYQGKCSIKTKTTDKKVGKVRKAGDNFEQFMKNLFVSTMDREHLLKYAKEIGLV
jgi:DNA repair exonuclease SbcCD nuclease subunit